MATRLTRRTLAKTASYTIKHPADPPGTEFTNMGASGPVTFTLPTPGPQLLGVPYTFVGIADQNVIVAGAAAGDVITKNNAAAASVAAQTGGEKIGAVIEAVCVKASDSAYKWRVVGTSVGHTFTVA